MTTSESFSLMEVGETNATYINSLPSHDHDPMVSSISSLQNEQISEHTDNNDSALKADLPVYSSAVWTTFTTSTLLKLYEAKLEMLETPKKKTRIWIAISESFKDYNVDVTPDQVRWKINALTKKYKRCIDMGKHEKFKYFKEMDSIYAKYNVDCDSYSITEFLSKKKPSHEPTNHSTSRKSIQESRAMIEMRKTRLANRIDCDRFQGKVKLEKQWLEYLHKQEELRTWRDNIFERKLKLKQEKLDTLKKELELKESLEYTNLQLMEKKDEELLQIEREKCELIKQIFR